MDKISKIDKQNKNELLFIPLGGACEIGMNFNVYYFKGKYLIVDVGIGFPGEHLPGVNVILACTKFIERYKSDIVGIVITHAHEDHAGGLIYQWDSIECPVYTTKFTAEMLKIRIAESDFKHEIPIVEILPNTPFDIGPFSIEMIGITHSIPEMHGLMIRTSKGNIFHTGDWKLDPDPVISDATDEQKLRQIGDEGILAMVCDSTNVFQEGRAGSEGELSENLYRLISKDSSGLVIITTFASNVARLHTIAKAAQSCGRRVILAGRALWRVYNAALNSGYLTDFHRFMDINQFKKYPRDKLVIICTGCQGEPLAAVNKIANFTHDYITLEDQDKVIFSSKIIPGNEKRIFGLLNKFCKMGVEVLTERDHFVHVSGHPHRDELAHMYKLIRPKIAIPVHGEAMHINEHCKFALSLGIEHVIEVENGDLVSLSSEIPYKIAKVESGYLAVDGNMIIEETSNIIKDRKRMRDNGIAIIILLMNKNKKLVRQPRVLLPGILDTHKDKDLEIADLIIEDIRDFITTTKKQDDKLLYKSVKNIVRKILRDKRQKEPYIIIQSEYIS